MDILSKRVNFEDFILETGLQEEEIKELYTDFLKELSDESKNLELHFRNGDYTRLAAVIHNVKGISGSYKLMAAYEIAVQLDAAMKAGKIETVKTGLATLIEEIGRASEQIRLRFHI